MHFEPDGDESAVLATEGSDGKAETGQHNAAETIYTDSEIGANAGLDDVPCEIIKSKVNIVKSYEHEIIIWDPAHS